MAGATLRSWFLCCARGSGCRRRELERHLTDDACDVVRKGANHYPEAVVAEWLPVVARYIATLAEALDTTTFAADRDDYKERLAEAARLVAILANDGDVSEARRWLAAEDRAYGWGYLSGPQGEAATNAFVELSSSLRAV